MKSTERFSNRVENYVKYRPSYPDALITELIAYTGLTPSSSIADVGSGTGIFSRKLLEKGLRVFGVEPNEEMRQASIDLLSAFPHFEAVDGTGEDTTLETDSVDLVTAAQSFHWFDMQPALAEFSRILKPGGHVALIWNERNAEGPFQEAYEHALHEHIDEYTSVNHRNISEEMIHTFFSRSGVHKMSFDYRQYFDLAGLKGRLLSSSYAPVKGQRNHDLIMQEMDRLFTAFETDGRIAFTYTTNAYVGQL